MVPAPWRLAAPSCVIADTVAANCRFLAGRVDEIALAFFETKSCLDYSTSDLGAELAALPGRNGKPLSFHVHLPLDLPWERGAEAVATASAALAEKTECLAPRFFVLHPPNDPRLFADFVAAWRGRGLDPERILLENIESCDLSALLGPAYDLGCGLCFDIGHALAFGQEALLERPETWRMLRCLHVYAPHKGPDCPTRACGGHGHYSLGRLDARGQALLRQTLAQAAALRDVCLVLELFDWPAVVESVSLLANMTLLSGSKY